MPHTMRLAMVIALAALATAQTSTVTQVFIPGTDQQQLVASVIGTGSNGVKTLAIECPSGTADDECGFPEPITITAGPSTFHLDPSGIYQTYGQIDCKITGTTEAACEVTQGVYDTQSLASATDTDWVTKPASTSTSTSTTLTGSDLQFISVTITAGEVSGTGTASENAGKATSASGSTSASRSTSGVPTTASGTGSGVATSATNNGAALADVAISGVAAGLLALPMFLM